MKHLLLLCISFALCFFSCKESCDKNDTGTIKITNGRSQSVIIDLDGFFIFTLIAGKTSIEEELSTGPWNYTATLNDGTVETGLIRINKCELGEFTF